MEPSPPTEADFAAVAQVLRRVCKDPLPGLTPASRLDALPTMDSLKQLHALALIEEEFGIEIDVAVLDYHLELVADVVTAVRAARVKAT